VASGARWPSHSRCEGADVALSYLPEEEPDAKESARWIEKAGRRPFAFPGDIRDENYCRELVEGTISQFGKLDILVNNAAYQASHENIEEWSSEEWDRTFRTNIYAMFYLSKAALPRMKPGSTIVDGRQRSRGGGFVQEQNSSGRWTRLAGPGYRGHPSQAVGARFRAQEVMGVEKRAMADRLRGRGIHSTNFEKESVMATDTMTLHRGASRTTRSLGRRESEAPTRPDSSGLTRFLGWFSIGLGVSEILAPGVIARIAGTGKRKNVIRSYGVREVAAGVGILTNPRPTKWLWARVAGDVVDLTSIVRGSRENRRGATAGALAAVAGVTALDIICAQRCATNEKAAWDGERAETNLLINQTPEECYQFWRNVENFPRFVPELRAVRKTGEKTSHWASSLPHGAGEAEWDAEIVEDVPNQRISWRSLPDQGITIDGTVEFEPAPGGRGTIVRVQLSYDHAGRAVASPIAKLLRKHPGQITNKALRRMKQLMEVGEILTTEGQPTGRRGSTTWLDQIAR